MKFYITIKNRIAEVLSDGGRIPRVVCDNAENTVEFLFDAEWDRYSVKTARFVYRRDMGKGALVYTDVTFSGNVVSIPTLHNVSEVFIGVIAGDLMTSSAARLSCIPSVCGFSAEQQGTTETETKRVALSLRDGDQIITPSVGKTMRSVIIEKPDTLVPENIRAGVMIAGILGTFGEGIDAPYVLRAGYTVMIYAVSGADLFDCHVVTPRGEDRIVATIESEGEYVVYDCEPHFEVGENIVYVVARNSITGLRSPESTRIPMTFVEDIYLLDAPPISISGSVITVGESGGNVPITFYKIYVKEGETELGMTSFEGRSFDLKNISSLTAGKTYTLTVTAYSMETLTESPQSNAVVYTVTDDGTDPDPDPTPDPEIPATLSAPEISVSGTKLTIYAVEGATVYEVHRVTNTDVVISTLSINGSTWIDIKGKLIEGKNNIYVVAKNSSGASAKSVTLTVNYDGETPTAMTPPTIAIDGDRILITPGQGDPATSYDLYVGGEMGYTTTDTVIDLNVALVGYMPGTYELWVRASIESIGAMSEKSNSVEYLIERQDEETSLRIFEATDSGGSFAYRINGSGYSDIMDGYVDGYVRFSAAGEEIAGVDGGDSVFVYISAGNWQGLTVESYKGCVARIDSQYGDYHLVIYDISGAAEVRLRVVPYSDG